MERKYRNKKRTKYDKFEIDFQDLDDFWTAIDDTFLLGEDYICDYKKISSTTSFENGLQTSDFALKMVLFMLLLFKVPQNYISKGMISKCKFIHRFILI